MAQRLLGKVALITGAASGIGRASALLFAREGAGIVVADLEAARPGSLETVRLIKEAGGQAVPVDVDVTVAAQVEAAVALTVEHFGQLDVMFNNAGTGELTTALVDLAEAEWERVMAVNVKGVFLGIKYAAAAMLQAGRGGSIINTASVAGIKGFPRHAAYSTSKAACIHLTKNAALELAPAKIRVNALAPAFTVTPMVMDSMVGMSSNPERALKRLENAIPLGRLGQPEEIAAAALYLASDEAAFVTGSVMTLDGGITA